MTVPVPLDLSALLTEHLPPSPSPEEDPADLDYCDVCGMRWPCDTRTLVRALRIAVEGLGRIGEPSCPEMRLSPVERLETARAALAAVRELVDLGGDDA